MAVQNVKGTHDILGEEANLYASVENLLKQIAELFGYGEVRPPVIEHSELFIRGVGQSSDVVRKEMYTFLDKGERSLSLRPEFTAGIIRLIVQNKLLAVNELPLKLYYCGPVFRYERPQLGRYRQFNQFGVESVGHDSPINDAEVISMAYTMLVSLGLENVKIKINTLGDDESREAYKKALKDFFAPKIEHMCEDCKSRYELNPLRILDCKVKEDQEIVKDAPKMSRYLNEASKARFDKVLDALKQLEIPFEVDDTLVRGLDYYSHTVFEFHYRSEKGIDYGAIGAGGHYGKLVKEVGGPDAPGIGFSFGVERLVSVIVDDNKQPEDLKQKCDVYVMPLGAQNQVEALKYANRARLIGFNADLCFDEVKLGSMFKRADKKGARVAVILGDNEVANHEVVVKNLKTTEQFNVPADLYEDKLVEILDDESCDCGCDGQEGDCCCHKHGKEGE